MRKVYFDYITSKIILKKGCEVFHGWNGQALRSIKSAKKIGAKTIIESGSTHRTYKNEVLSSEYRKFGINIKRSTEAYEKASFEELALADFIFLPSEFAKKSFIEAGFGQDMLFVIERGADLSRFVPGNPDNKTFKVLFVGRVSLRKGVQYLLEAWNSLKLKNSELIIAGAIDDTIRPVLSKYARNQNIKFTGFLKDPSSIYRDAHVFVFPSLEEGSAKVTFEAMASGMPVITTANSGSIVRDSIDGFIITPADATAIKEKILYFYENPGELKVMGANAVERAKPYTWERYRNKLIDTYERLFN